MAKKARNRTIKLASLLLALSLLTPSFHIHALGGFGGEGNGGYTPPPVDVPVDEGEGEDVDIEIDESLPVFVQGLKQLKPFESGELISRDLVPGDELQAESDKLRLYVNEETLAIKVEDKVDGYVWSSALNKETVRGLSASWVSFATSPVTIDYMDPTASSSLLRDFPELVELVESEDGVDMKLYFPRAKLELILNLRLHDYLEAAIQDDSIVYEDGEDRKYNLARLFIMPFWGAVEDGETEGYLFVPDGSGALIRFEGARPYESGFEGRVYGSDEGVKRQGMTLTRIPRVDSPLIHMPVYGVSHGHQQQATLAVIDSGAEYADISATPAGVRTKYYWTTAIFNYNESFFQPTGRGGEGFPYATGEAYEVDPSIRFYLLRDDAADYTGMAIQYREYLKEKGVIGNEAVEATSQLPLLIQAFMAEQEKGLFTNKLKVMTTTENVISWLPRLEELAGDELVLSLYGGQKRGFSGRDLGSLSLNWRVGGKKGWNNLLDSVNELGVELLMNTELAIGFEPQLNRGDMVYNIDRSIASRSTQNPLYSEQYFLKASEQAQLISNLAGNDSIYGQAGLDLSTIGHTLLSDYKNGKRIGRLDVQDTLTTALNNLDQEKEVYLELPHSYLFGAADAIYSAPSQNSQLLFESDLVPFYEIVLSGSVKMFSTPLNFGSQERQDILRLIDFNLYPTFMATAKESAELNNSNTRDIYYSEFEALATDIQAIYGELNEVLTPVIGAEILKRDIPANNISVTEYSNGQTIIVNYSNRPYDYQGVEVAALSAVVRGSDSFE